jgi:hypothetical protein
MSDVLSEDWDDSKLHQPKEDLIANLGVIRMKRKMLWRFLLLAAVASGFTIRLLAQDVDPKTVAKVVTDGKVKFSSLKSITVWLDGNQKYSVYPVTVENNESHEYQATVQPSGNEMKAATSEQSSRSESRPVAAGFAAFQAIPRPPPPPPPPNHGGPRPPLPIPPRPSNRRPTPQPPPPPPKKADLAAEGAIVGRLVTDGISQTNWRLPKGAYTIVLTVFEGKPVAALVNAEGGYVASFDNIFFLEASEQTQK